MEAWLEAESDRENEPVAALYRLHYERLVRAAWLLSGDAGVGEEIAQEAFARLLERWAKLSHPEAALGYLQVSVVNLCRGRLRRILVARRHPVFREEVVEAPEAERGPGEVTAVREALRRLPYRQREAVVLRFYLELTDSQVAAAMGLSLGAVKSHLHRGMAKLTKELEPLR